MGWIVVTLGYLCINHKIIGICLVGAKFSFCVQLKSVLCFVPL